MRIANLAAISLLALSAGCTTMDTGPAEVPPAREAQQRADVNPGYQAGSVPIPTKPTATLEQMIAKTGTARQSELVRFVAIGLAMPLVLTRVKGEPPR